MHLMLFLLTAVSRAHCLVDFFGKRVNCSITLAEEAGLVAVRGLPDVHLCISHTVPCVSNFSRMSGIVRCVGGSVAYSIPPLSLYFHNVLEFQIPLQNGLALLERQPCFHHYL